MAELDRLKEQVAYLRFWLVIMAATVTGLVGYLAATAGMPTSRDLIVGMLLLAVVLVFVGIALHAAYRKYN